jgi:hypothetical protein
MKWKKTVQCISKAKIILKTPNELDVPLVHLTSIMNGKWVNWLIMKTL